ncbi:hypothetical protein FNB15_12130 [Ferrovibrio terrae]|uniref:2OG-Fe(II) oxygenase n=1 Tax=Ferrovibrio terrae TaxID=2594003 RepID=A0A516H2G7_9PROT|nr:hypothetical protein [Ferrovibrio terrae]QDO97971.1 hypothetical protein FNB15_12130 [Ferrovibrio terrae]
MRCFPDQFADLLTTRGEALLAGRHTQAGALANPRTRFLALDGLVDPKQARAVAMLLEKYLLPYLREMAQPIPPETIWEQTQNYAEQLPKTMRQQTAHLDNPRSAAFKVAQEIGLVACLRSDSYRAFAAALAGRTLKKKYGLQAIAYGAGDYAGPHTDHHPEEPAAARGYLDMHLSFATTAVRDQYLVYAKTGHFTEMVEVTQKPGLVTAYRLPFWHYTTPLRAKPKQDAKARRWVLLGTFLFDDQA